MSETTRSADSVSVPVLSVQTISADASDSTAFSCWVRIPRLREAKGPRDVDDAREQDEPLRHHVDGGSDDGREPLVERRAAQDERDGQREDERYAERDQRDDQAVDPFLQRRRRMAELARLADELLRIALDTDRRADERAGSLDDERAGEDVLTGRLHHRVRLAGQDRLVDP